MRLRFGLLVLVVAALGFAQQPELDTARTELASGELKQAEASVRRVLAIHADSADAHKLLGYILFKENQPKESLQEYLSAGRSAPLGAPEFEVMGCDYFLLENYLSADEWLTRSIQSGNKNALAFYLLGRTKYNEKHFAEAVSFLQKSLALDPKDVKAETSLGHAYEQLGDSDKAVAAYRDAIMSADQGVSPDPDPYAALGALLIHLNRPAEAVPVLTKAVQLAPDSAAAHVDLERAYLALSQATPSGSELKKAVQIDPGTTAPQRFRALAGSDPSTDDPLADARNLVHSNRPQQAERVVRRYLDLHKNSAEAHYLLGYILFRERKATDSLAEYTEGAKYRRPSARDLEAVAGDYVLLHDYTDADKWFTQSLAWDPGNWQTLYYLGRTKYNENRFDEAVAIFRKCLQADPKSVKAEDNLGLSLEGLGRTEDAVAAYRKAIDLDAAAPQKDAGPYLDLGTVLVTGNRDSGAVPYLRRALQIAPADVRVHRQLGKAYLHLNQLDQAKAELEKSVQLAPDDAPTHFLLVQVYRKLGLHDKEKQEIARLTALNGAHSTE